MSVLARKLIRKDEGYSDIVYLDTLGNLTCGIGHLLSIGSLVPDQAIEAFFEADFLAAILKYKSYNFKLNYVREAVIISMLFQLGNKFREFVLLIRALYAGDFAKAAFEMKNSEWYSQCPQRAERLRLMMLTGEEIEK